MKTYWYDAFKDDQTKQWSFSRVSGAVVLLWVCIVASILIYKQGTISTQVYQLMALFVGYTTAAYGLNKGISHFGRNRFIEDIDEDEDDKEC